MVIRIIWIKKEKKIQKVELFKVGLTVSQELVRASLWVKRLGIPGRLSLED